MVGLLLRTFPLLLVLNLAFAQEVIRGSAEVIDGDTLRVDGKVIRLFGIDAPEQVQLCTHSTRGEIPCGAIAEGALRNWIGGVRISCTAKFKDRYDRIVALCRAPDGTDIGERLVREGIAVTIAHGDSAAPYTTAQEMAQKEKAAIWNGTFELPQVYRKRRSELGLPPAKSIFPQDRWGTDLTVEN